MGWSRTSGMVLAPVAMVRSSYAQDSDNNKTLASGHLLELLLRMRIHFHGEILLFEELVFLEVLLYL